MSRSPLTLAALATSAIPGLNVVSAALHTAGSTGRYDSAVIIGEDGSHYIIRVPETPAAYRLLEAELKSLSALSAGIRTRLPFAIPSEAGRVDVGGLSALVYTYVPGVLIDVTRLSPTDGLSTSIGESLAALHALPTGFIDDYGLPHETPEAVRESVRQLLVRAEASRLVPPSLLERWTGALDDDPLWEFDPTVVHGDLDDQCVLVEHSHVSGVLSWSQLRISDPALDLAWLIHAAPVAAIDSVFAAYARDLQEGSSVMLRRRATLHAELHVARWLLHGVDKSDAAIVDDAKSMLDRLADTVLDDYQLALTDVVFEAERDEHPSEDAEPVAIELEIEIEAEAEVEASEPQTPAASAAAPTPEQTSAAADSTTPAADEPDVIITEEHEEIIVAEVIDEDEAAPVDRPGANEETATVVDDAAESSQRKARSSLRTGFHERL